MAFVKPRSTVGKAWKSGLDLNDNGPMSDMVESASSRRRPPLNTTPFFRLNLSSNHGVANSGNNTWNFLVNIPEELEAGMYCIAAETVVVSGATPSTTAADRIVDFHLQGLALRDSYNASSSGDSTLLVSHVRTAASTMWTRDVSTKTLGIPLADLGQIRGRNISIILRNGDGVIHPNDGVTNWRLVLVIYRIDL